MTRTRRRLLALLAGAPLALGAGAASRPLRLLVPGGTGGVIDTRARWLAPRLAAELDRPVVVDNRPGAAGNLGMREAARAAPDGTTMVVVHLGTMAANPHLHADAGYDPLRDFRPLTRLGHGPLACCVRPGPGPRTLPGFLDEARRGRLSYATSGAGSPPHLATLLLLRLAGLEATHVPYPGGGQALRDVIAGHVDFTIEGTTVVRPHAEAGRLVALGVTGRERLASWPGVPAIRENLPGYEFEGWVGLALPAATSDGTAAALHEALMRVLRSEEARRWFAESGAEVGAEAPESFGAFVRAEHRRWGEVLRAAPGRPSPAPAT